LHAGEGDVGFVGHVTVVCGEGLETVLSRASQRHVGRDRVRRCMLYGWWGCGMWVEEVTLSI
jgi:hypothetical protein